MLAEDAGDEQKMVAHGIHSSIAVSFTRAIQRRVATASTSLLVTRRVGRTANAAQSTIGRKTMYSSVAVSSNRSLTRPGRAVKNGGKSIRF
jgi:hypothetical protein